MYCPAFNESQSRREGVQRHTVALENGAKIRVAWTQSRNVLSFCSPSLSYKYILNHKIINNRDHGLSIKILLLHKSTLSRSIMLVAYPLLRACAVQY